jgi:hypothetical protein
VVTALVSVDGPTDGPDPIKLRESVPHLVVTGECGCGCPSFFLSDSRVHADASEASSFHYSNATTRDGRIGLFLLVRNDRPSSVDVMLPPDIEGDAPEARPSPDGFIVTTPYGA